MAPQKARAQKSADAYRSIGEAAAELGLETHVLRYWETRFPKDVRPVKRPDGRRLFRPQDMGALRAIRFLVHDQGMSLKGAGALLSEQGVANVLAWSDRAVFHGREAPAARSPARDLQEALAQAFGTVPELQELTPEHDAQQAESRTPDQDF